jgi:hypothetical protein
VIYGTCLQCNDQIRVISVSMTSEICHLFVLGTFKVLFSSYFEISIKLFLIIATLLYYITLKHIPPI